MLSLSYQRVPHQSHARAHTRTHTKRQADSITHPHTQTQTRVHADKQMGHTERQIGSHTQVLVAPTLYDLTDKYS